MRRCLHLTLVASLSALLCILAIGPAAAQRYNQTIGFGDSTIDSGWYRNPAFPPNSTDPLFNTDFTIAVQQGGGKATTNPGQVSIEVLAGRFGLNANPANQPGGTDYATGDAMNAQPTTTGLTGAVPTATQIANYLASTGGVANPNALFVISSGGNDVLSAGATTLSVTTAAGALVNAISQLQAAGARYIVVPNLFAEGAGLTPAQRQLFATYNNSLWSGLASAGVNFVPVDTNSVLLAVKGNPTFGFTATGAACTTPAGFTGPSWATMCSTTSSVSTLVSADAAQTHLLADLIHLSTAGQRIVADYEYSLLVAPSMISMMAEAPVKTRAAMVNAIDNQIAISLQNNGPSRTNGWVTGDVGSLQIRNAPGFPDDPGTPVALTAGLDRKLPNGWLLGLAFSVGTQKANFSDGFGSFRQDEFAVSGYAARSFGRLWLHTIGSYGAIHYDSNRTVPIGIAVLPNSATVSGSNLSLAVNTGVDFAYRNFTHGPILGVTAQHVTVGSFTESGSFTALSFDRQLRDSVVTGLGYQFAIEMGQWRPFAKAAWNHEWIGNGRVVTASLTTVAAPSFSLPAVVLGTDWGVASAGTTVRITDRVSGLMAFTGQFAQQQATAYGGQLGLNVAF